MIYNRMTQTEIDFGNKYRELTSKDIKRTSGTKDLRGWIISFFGENTRAAILFERVLANKIGIPAHFIELWSLDAPIKEQVRLFNDTLSDILKS